MIIENCLQGSPEWEKIKIGKPSASNASRIITTGGKPSEQRKDYLYELAGELLTGKREDSYKDANMETGNIREEESRNFFEFVYGVEVTQVGVIYKDKQKKFLCSPDGVVLKEKYGLEMKNVIPKTQVKYLLENKLPAKHFSQIQFSLYVTGFDYWIFLSYVPSMKPLIIKVEPDKDYQKALKVELKKFCDELQIITEKLRGE